MANNLEIIVGTYEEYLLGFRVERKVCFVLIHGIIGYTADKLHFRTTLELRS